MKRLIWRGALLLGILSSSHVAFADTLDDIRAKGEVTIAVDFTHPPYGMLNQQSQQAGSDFDVAQAIAHDLGVKLKVLPVTGPNRIPFLLTDKADLVIASFAVTPEREKVVDFTRAYATQPIFIVASGKGTIKDLDDLRGKAVAVARGNTADLQLEKQVADRKVPDVTFVRYLDEATQRAAVLSGQQTVAVAAIADALTLKQLGTSYDYQYQIQITEDKLSIALRKGNPKLKAWLDQWIAASLQDGRLNTIWKRYFGIDLPVSLSQLQ